MENEETLQTPSSGKFQGRRFSPITGKFAGVVVLVLLLIVPLSMIHTKITERGHYQSVVTEEIAQTAAGEQTLTGPVLAIRYHVKTPAKTYFDTYTKKTVTTPPQTEEHITVVPAKTLTIKGNAEVEQRYRGIYRASLFHLDLNLQGIFSLPADMKLILDVAKESKIIDASAVMLFGVSDLRGIDVAPEVLIDQRPMHFMTPKDTRFARTLQGNRLEIDLGALTFGTARDIDFSFPLKLTGTASFNIAPTAENNAIQLKSNWQHPSFHGRFLPRSRQIGDDGFTAQWEVSQLARNLESTLNGEEALGIRFMDPINIYLQSERALKYGNLFIVLTFAAFFIYEIARRRPVHFLQYLLVGLALTIFFLLLIALSEHLPFLSAYLAAAAACIGLIVLYLAGMFGSWRVALVFGGCLAGLYAMIYAILQLEDMALLMGSALLFAALAVVMLSTRRFDWYALTERKKNP
ncbi:MAG: cell envelope integrity protein CreD [Zoogloeaceae bacterium]|jgi:inner membrane protein|nr:cell envelope integrity protein CreD [Zoogloeaceae bacterium]